MNDTVIIQIDRLRINFMNTCRVILCNLLDAFFIHLIRLFIMTRDNFVYFYVVFIGHSLK